MNALEPAHARPVVVLVAPKEPGNVGAAARAMKNMGLSDLRLVAPRCRLEAARPLAVHAADLLDAATVCDTLLEAVGECDLVAATTARRRRDRRAPSSPREAAPRIGAATSPAVVFGREESGLTNEELDLCHLDLTIPTDGEYASLNLGQAVLLVAYELMLARERPAPPPPPPAASRAELEGMHAHLLELMLEVGYTDRERQDHITRRFREILERASLAPSEVDLVRGLLAQGLWAARRNRALEEAR